MQFRESRIKHLKVALSKFHLGSCRNDRQPAVTSGGVTGNEVTEALADFDSVWDALATHERVRIVELLIERIEFHRADGDLDITFRPTGVKTLITEREEVAV
jgi:hypothetical protein